MGGRYLITGVQLGLLMTLPEKNSQELLDEIIVKQFLFESSGTISEDMERVSSLLPKKD